MSEPPYSSPSTEKLEDAILKLTSLNLTLGESVQSMNLRFDALLQRLSSPFPFPPPNHQLNFKEQESVCLFYSLFSLTIERRDEGKERGIPLLD